MRVDFMLITILAWEPRPEFPCQLCFVSEIRSFKKISKGSWPRPLPSSGSLGFAVVLPWAQASLSSLTVGLLYHHSNNM